MSQDSSHAKGSYPIGTIVSSGEDEKRTISVIAKAFRTAAGQQRYTIRPLNSEVTSVVEASKVKPVIPDPADIPLHQKEVDKFLLRDELSDKDMKQLWARDSDSTITKAQRLARYWHKKLQHLSLIHI